MRIKSFLLVPVLTGLSCILLYALYMIISQGYVTAWTGVLLAAFPLPVFISYIMLTERLARTSANLPYAIAISAIGCALTLISFSNSTQPVLAFTSLLALLWYVFIYSRFGRTASKTLQVGTMLPDFTLETTTGQHISSDTFRRRASLFLFYRGNWCPLCMAQIQEIATAYKQLNQLGVEVILVSPQSHKQTEKLAAKYDVPFRFLVDPGLKAAKALDIMAAGGTPAGIDILGYGTNTVMPTVIATDTTGKVIFLDETDNYRVRPEPETFIEIYSGQLEPAGSV